jgi:hypothetical protein
MRHLEIRYPEPKPPFAQEPVTCLCDDPLILSHTISHRSISFIKKKKKKGRKEENRVKEFRVKEL